MEYNSNAIRQKVKNGMLTRGWSTYRLAKESGVNKGTLSTWFSGSDIRLETFLKIADVLKIEIN